MAKFYVTTSIAYVNGAPHIGFAMELVEGDILARWHRLIGDATFFLTGTDENSLKLLKAAEKAGTTPQELADTNAARFIELTEKLNLSNDDFIRTTDEKRHFPGAQKIWQALDAKGLIYKGTYEGLYCIECEQFYTEKELRDGKCPIHGIELQHIKEDNYFFKLSEFSEQLAQRIESDELRIVPSSRKHEILNVIKGGLQDISFSRPAEKLGMGIPVPGDESQHMYVWCDALTNYITAIGYGRDEELFTRWWPADVHLIGKDIIRFHAAVWPAMLLAADLLLPKSLAVHGFINVEGEKMSKSKGNVIDPFEVLAHRGIDATRYYLARFMPLGSDGDYSEQHFTEIYDAELANDLGNLFSRVTAMIGKAYEGQVPEGTADAHLKEHVGQTYEKVKNHLDDFAFAQAIEAIHDLVVRANKFIDEKRPYKQAGQDKADTLYTLAQVLGHLSLLYEPVIPQTARIMRDRLSIAHDGWEWNSLLTWEKIVPGNKIVKGESLFPKAAT